MDEGSDDDRRALHIVLPVLVLALGAFTVLGMQRYIDPDEIESLRAAWKLWHGHMIYRDFFEHHHPLWYMVLAPFFAVLPEQASALQWMRAVNLVLAGGNLLLCFCIGRRLFGTAAACGGVVLLAGTHIYAQKAIELRPDNLQTLFGLAGLLLLLRVFERPHVPAAVATGVLFGLAFVALQKAAFLLAAVGMVVLLRLLRQRLPARVPGSMAVGFAVAVAPFALWLAANDTLGLFLVLNYRLNAEQAYVAGPIETLSTDPQVFAVLRDSFVINTVFWAFAAAGLFGVLRRSAEPAMTRVRREMAFIAAVLVLWVVLFNKYYWQYYLPALPLLAVFGGGAMLEALRRRRATLGALLAFSCVGAMRDAGESLYLKNNDWQRGAFARALELTRPGDLVMDTRLNFNLFRPDLAYMWFAHEDGLVPMAYTAVTGRREDVLDLVASRQPVLVNIEGLPPGSWPGDPRLAGYRGAPGLNNVLIRADRAP